MLLNKEADRKQTFKFKPIYIPFKQSNMVNINKFDLLKIPPLSLFCLSPQYSETDNTETDPLGGN